MKKLLYTFLAVSLIFSACKKEDDEPSTNNTSASILGIWEIANVTETSTQGYLDPIQGTEVVTSAVEGVQYNYPLDGYYFTWTFKYDGGLTRSQYNNDTLSSSEDQSYVKDGNTITVDSESIYTITTLTNSTLSFNFSNSWENVYNDTTFFSSYTGSATWIKSNKKINSSIQSQNKTGKTPFFKQFIDRRKQ